MNRQLIKTAIIVMIMMKQLRKIPQQNKVLRNVEKFSLSQDLQGFFLKKKVS